MQSITNSARYLARSSPLRRTVYSATLTARPFSAQARLSLKEDHVKDDAKAEELDRIKHEQIEKQKQGKGHWHEELASSGEANVKADKHDINDHDSHMEDLQKQTAEKHEKDHPHGKAEH